MPFGIQRVPRGLADLLNIFGGATPRELEDRIRGSLDMLQMYGTTQLQSAAATNAAAAENAAVAVILSSTRWTVLFAAHGTVVKTATVTALRADVTLNRGTQFSPLLFADELGPFGATETGNASFGGMLPYPLLCPPGSLVQCTARIIGTDATANVSVFAEFGTL